MTASNDYSAQVSINGMAFNTGLADVVTPAQEWYAAVVGWEACPKRVVSLPNVHEDGDQPQYMTLAARPLTLRGTVKVTGANPQTLLDAAKARLLLAVMAHPDALATLTVAETLPTVAGTFAYVHLAEDAPQWNVASCDDVGGVARFQVGLVVPAGAKYSVVEITTALGAGLATPAPTAPTTATTGGSLVPGVYGYRVAAVGGAGETLASPTIQAVVAQLPTPGTPSVSTGSGGSLPVAVYSYRVAAVNAAGTTLASAAATVGVGGGSTFANTITWSPVAGATGYNVYGRTSGSYLKLTPVAVTDTSFVDTGAVTPSGAVPASNTTATTTNTVTFTWSPVAGATGYNVYGRTSGAELKLTAVPLVVTTYTDTGAVTPSGALPVGGAASVTLTNGGNWPSPPLVTVVGAATGPISIGTGARVMQVGTALGAGETLVVDFRLKTVTINGVDRRDLVPGTSVWWKLPVGAAVVNYAGGGTASIKHRHTYG